MHRSLFPILSLCFLSSCSTPIIHEEEWFRQTEYDGKPFYMTKCPITWQGTAPGLYFGHWRAVTHHGPFITLTADGNQFSISSNYVWDGVSKGITTQEMLCPSLFHDAMLHAKMNGAPIQRAQIDRAFYELMKENHVPYRGSYYRLVRLFGWIFTRQQVPRTLTVTAMPPESHK